MKGTIVSQGKTTNEAIENGLKELGVSKEMVDIKVLEEEKRSFYSILSPRVVKVELTIKENASNIPEKRENVETKPKKTNENTEEINEGLENIKKFLDKFLSEGMVYTAEIKEFDIYININGENLNHLIGYRGENINSLQTILTAIANKKSTAKIRVYLDIAGYREKRIKTLEELAEKVARTVIRSRKAVSLEPMSAYERKIIHTTLQSNDRVKTFSRGEEPYRKVIISLK